MRCPGHQGRIWSVALSPDGKTRAVVESDEPRVDRLVGNTIRILDEADGKELVRLAGRPGSQLQDLAFSPDGKQITYLRVNFPRAGESAVVVAGIDREMVHATDRAPAVPHEREGGPSVGRAVEP